jgi:hypothetical protein
MFADIQSHSTCLPQKCTSGACSMSHSLFYSRTRRVLERVLACYRVGCVRQMNGQSLPKNSRNVGQTHAAGQVVSPHVMTLPQRKCIMRVCEFIELSTFPCSSRIHIIHTFSERLSNIPSAVTPILFHHISALKISRAY